MPPRLRVGVCVPTVRDDAIRAFVEAWAPHWTGDAADVHLFVHEDRPYRTPSLVSGGPLALTHTAQEDIAPLLGHAEWIIPRGAGACRSFPMLLAWRAGCDYVITLDDDCYPLDGDGDGFLDAHLAAFTRDRWFRTIAGDEPRGIPYERRGALPVKLNHGLWTDVPDLDGPTSLVRLRDPKAVHLPAGYQVVPPGMAFPLCAMNVCYDRAILPAAYNLLMGLEAVGFDRFDDIWSGLLIKRVLDYMGWYATTGEPRVRHVKRSNAFVNLRKEALGIQIHERLWDYLLDAPLAPGLDVAGAFAALAEHVGRFPEAASDVPCPDGYFPKVASAMTLWAGLFAESPAAPAYVVV